MLCAIALDRSFMSQATIMTISTPATMTPAALGATIAAQVVAGMKCPFAIAESPCMKMTTNANICAAGATAGTMTMTTTTRTTRIPSMSYGNSACRSACAAVVF